MCYCNSFKMEIFELSDEIGIRIATERHKFHIIHLLLVIYLQASSRKK